MGQGKDCKPSWFLAGAVGGLIAGAVECPTSGNKPWANSWLEAFDGLDAFRDRRSIKGKARLSTVNKQPLHSLISSI